MIKAVYARITWTETSWQLLSILQGIWKHLWAIMTIVMICSLSDLSFLAFICASYVCLPMYLLTLKRCSHVKWECKSQSGIHLFLTPESRACSIAHYIIRETKKNFKEILHLSEIRSSNDIVALCTVGGTLCTSRRLCLGQWKVYSTLTRSDL